MRCHRLAPGAAVQIAILVMLATHAWGQAPAQAQPSSPTPAASAAEPAQYQLIRARFRLLDRNGRTLEGATLAARLDGASSRLPPDRVLRIRAARDEYAYGADDSTYAVLSSEQISKGDGIVELPVIVYQNRTELIDYELAAFYGTERMLNRLYPRERKRAFSSSDASGTGTLQLDVVAEVPVSNYWIAVMVWIGATVMGCLLFFRGVYRALLSGGKSIDLSRALCWSGALLVSIMALGIVYWLFLPQVLNFYILCGFLLLIWILHLLFTVVPKRQAA